MFLLDLWVKTVALRLSEQLEEQLEATIQGLGYVYVGSEAVSAPGAVLRIYVEGKPDNSGNTNIGLDEIMVISRQLSALMDVEAPGAGRYRLEVSSPGLDRRLFKLADYQRFLGSEVKIRLYRPLEGRRNWHGTLVEVSTEEITINSENQTYRLAFSNIEKAHLVPKF